MRGDMQLAVRMLEEALAPVATIRTETAAFDARWRGTSPEDMLSAQIEGGGRGDGAAALVRSWDELEEADPTVTNVWVVRGRPLAQLREWRTEGRSFVDVGRGVVRVQLPWLLVDRNDIKAPPRVGPERVLRGPFGDRASLITRLLIARPDERWGTRALADAAGVSTMTASHVVQQLSELGALEVTKRGRAFEVRIADLRRLVEQWTQRYDWQRSPQTTFHAPIGSPERFIRRLPRQLAGVRWALTLQAGASLVTPHATWESVHLYLDAANAAALPELARHAGWEAAGPGARGNVVVMRPWYADSIWTEVRAIDGIPVVSDLQLILDLWHYPLRGREQAEVLLAQLARRIAAAAARTPASARA
jgi:Transcriptional regulator, AbiEi antitoxin, Type IV TA system